MAFANTVDDGTWSSSICYNKFSTGSIEKEDDESWELLYVDPSEISFTPSATKYLLTIPKDENGVSLWDDYVYASVTVDAEFEVAGIDNDPIHFVIKNPHGPGGPNMKSKGRFEGYAE